MKKFRYILIVDFEAKDYSECAEIGRKLDSGHNADFHDFSIKGYDSTVVSRRRDCMPDLQKVIFRNKQLLIFIITDLIGSAQT